jgi:hypothetical protein
MISHYRHIDSDDISRHITAAAHLRNQIPPTTQCRATVRLNESTYYLRYAYLFRIAARRIVDFKPPENISNIFDRRCFSAVIGAESR